MFTSVRLLVFSTLLLLSACAESSSSSFDLSTETTVVETISAQDFANQLSPSVIRPPQTSIFCPDCELVDVIGVVDGDTIDTSVGRVRFFGVDTPERGDACSTEATEFTRLLAGSQVRLENGPRLEDSFGRRLAYVYDPSGNSIDAQLIVGGFATAWTRDGQHRDVLSGLERSAQSDGAGCLWSLDGAVASRLPLPAESASMPSGEKLPDIPGTVAVAFTATAASMPTSPHVPTPLDVTSDIPTTVAAVLKATAGSEGRS